MTFYKLWANSLMPAQDFSKFSSDAQKLCRTKDMRMYLEGLIRHEVYGDAGIAISGETRQGTDIILILVTS